MKYLITVIIAFLITFSLIDSYQKDKIYKRKAINAVVGEASNQDYQGMLVVAVGIRNRGTLEGVRGVNAKHNSKESYKTFELARKAWKESLFNRIHEGTYWENIKTFGKPKWADEKIKVYEYRDHTYYRDKK